MQRSDEIQGLLSDLDDDEGLAENVWSDVVTAMDRAWEQLHDYSAEARGLEALTRAAEEVQRGVALLAAVHERLERLEAEESARAQIGRQAPRPLRVRWISR
ncbi:MAG TPA: hypothetical protein VIK32_17460 [Candidatus Limnocylindrales bacterium]|jgi:hypothetical protein